MLYLILVSIMLFVSVSLSGLFAPPFPQYDKATATRNEYTCCDTGDGKDCQPRTDVPSIQYQGAEYQLLKSDMYLQKLADEEHLDPAPNQPNLPAEYDRAFINVANGNADHDHLPDCKLPDPDHDWLYGKPVDGGNKFGCYQIPNDLLIYLCRKDSGPGACNGPHQDDRKVKFDTWIRVKDVQQTGVPEVIASCWKPTEPDSAGEEKIVFHPSPGGGQNNLQLRTFSFISQAPVVPWLSPYCKPAIYLYPEQKTEINVSVFPQGKMLLTIPPYPKDGWDVIADPTGAISYQNKQYDYLYYEASIPDELIAKPKAGYVIPFAEREEAMEKIVISLGLNDKETKQFIEYWTPILPKSPYYFIGIVPVANLHEISPLLITPKPDNLLRVTLYFEPLDQPITVTPPTIQKVSRDGFTAVEWGGIYKRDKDHPFSCFM